MSKKIPRKAYAHLAKVFASLSVRNNTSLEDLHAGTFPSTKTGDYSDVKVIDGEGNEIPWNELSRLSDDEMRILVKKIVNNLYTCLVRLNDPNFKSTISLGLQMAVKWDEPELLNEFLSKGNTKKLRRIVKKLGHE